MAVKFPKVRVKLLGEDGNAFAIMGRVTRAMRRAGVPQADIDEYVRSATSGDYTKLLRVTMATVQVDTTHQPPDKP